MDQALLSDADVFGAPAAAAPAPSSRDPLVYGPGSAYSGQAPTPAQHKYAYAAAMARDPRAPPGSAENPTYDTPDATGKGLYHVNQQGQLVDEHPQIDYGPHGKSLMTDADVFGAHAGEPFDPAKKYDMRPVDQTLGSKEGAYTVGTNLADVLSMRLPGMKPTPAAGVMYLPQLATDLFSTLARHSLNEQEKTARPGLAGKVATEIGLTLPLGFAAEGAPLLAGAAQGDLTSGSRTDALERLRDIGIGAAGGKLADMGVGGAKAIISPTIRPEAQWAIDNNIRLTPGGIAGGLARGFEAGASKGTIAGPMVGAAQRRGIEDFNIATANHVLDGTGLALPEGVAAGHEAVNATHNLLSGAFNSLAPKLSLGVDAPLAAAQSEATNAGTLMPAAYRARMDALVGQLPAKAGPINGRAVQDLTAQLRQEAADAAQSGDFFAKDYGRAVDKLRSAVEDGLERANPDHANTLQALRTAWAKQVRVERAATGAVQDGGVYTPKGLLAAVRGSDQSARDNATARGEALLQDWANNGKAVLPDKLPNAGSLWAHIPELAVTYGVGQEAGVPGIAGLLATEGLGGLAYTKPAQAAIRAAMTQRPAVAKTAADIIQRLRPLSMPAGAGTAQNVVWPALQAYADGRQP